MQAATTGNVIVLFPQAVTTMLSNPEGALSGLSHNTNSSLITTAPSRMPPVVHSLSLFLSPAGCFDWWGYTNSDFANKKGIQIQTIVAMVDALQDNNIAWSS